MKSWREAKEHYEREGEAEEIRRAERQQRAAAKAPADVTD